MQNLWKNAAPCHRLTARTLICIKFPEPSSLYADGHRRVCRSLLAVVASVVPGTLSTAICSGLPVHRGRAELLPFLLAAIF